MEYSEAKAGLQQLIRKIAKRIKDETDDSEFGNIDVLLYDAALLASELGFPFPPIQQIYCDEEEGFVLLPRPGGRQRQAVPWHDFEIRDIGAEFPWVYGLWGYRLHDPQGGHKDIVFRSNPDQMFPDQSLDFNETVAEWCARLNTDEFPRSGWLRSLWASLDGAGRTKVEQVFFKILTRWTDELNDMPGTQAEAAQRQRSKPKLGRPPETDPDKDKRIYNAWKTGRYRTLDELAQALDKKGGQGAYQIRLAIDRHRKRLSRSAEKGWTNPPSE